MANPKVKSKSRPKSAGTSKDARSRPKANRRRSRAKSTRAAKKDSGDATTLVVTD